jgi:glutathione S-transferase
MSTHDSISVVSIKVSQGCEMARWLLQRGGLSFVENFQAPLLHVIATRAAGGGNEAPVLVIESAGTKAAFGTLPTIIEAIDGLCPAGAKVYGETEAERVMGKAFIDRVVQLFGPWMRQYPYDWILKDPPLMMPLATAGVPWWQRLVVVWFYPIWAWLLRKGLAINPQTIAAAPAQIEHALDTIAQELTARGTPYFGGETPGGLDVVVAALMSPATFPPQFGGILPPADVLPPILRDFVLKMRAKPGGQYGLKVYDVARAC